MLHRLTLSVLAVIAAAAALAATHASAGTGTSAIPNTAAPPWSDPAHGTPLERLASQIASHIAQRPVTVRCHSPADWEALTASLGLDGTAVWGYVLTPQLWYSALGTWAESATGTELSPAACERLWELAKATTKPTMCSASRGVTETKHVRVRYRATVRVTVVKRHRVGRRWVTRRATERRRVWRIRTEARVIERRETVAPRPCFGAPESGVSLGAPAGGWEAYAEYAMAIQTLTHESAHLLSFTVGRPVPSSVHAEESRAECIGMQHIPFAAEALGASPEDARAIAQWYWSRFYPSRQASSPEYWSPDCREDGALDATPGDGVWPQTFAESPVAVTRGRAA